MARSGRLRTRHLLPERRLERLQRDRRGSLRRRVAVRSRRRAAPRRGHDPRGERMTRGARGFTLLEVAIALAILGVGVVTVLELFSAGLRMETGREELEHGDDADAE